MVVTARFLPLARLVGPARIRRQRRQVLTALAVPELSKHKLEFELE